MNDNATAQDKPATLALPEALATYKLSTLMRMARANEIEITDRRKESLVQALLDSLYTATGVARALARLTARDVAVLHRLQAMAGEVRSSTIKTELVRARIVVDSPDSAPAVGQPLPLRSTFEGVTVALMEHGLVLSRQPADADSALVDLKPGDYLWIPDEVRRRLPPLPEVKPPEIPVRVVREGSARTLQRDLYLYWSFVREAPLALTQAQWLRKHDLRDVNTNLLLKSDLRASASEREARRLFFLRRLLQGLDLLTSLRGQLIAVETGTFLGLDPLARVKRCFDLWQTSRMWNEIYALNGVRLHSADTALSLAPAGVVTARATVLRHLAELPGEGWVRAEALLKRLRNLDYEFLIPRPRRVHDDTASLAYRFRLNPYLHNAYGWTFEDMYGEETGWNRVETGFSLNVLREGLYWLGLVDLGYDSETAAGESFSEPPLRIAAYRLTEMGRWLLHGAPPPQVNIDTGRVIVQPTFDVLALDPVSDVVLAALDQFCERLSAERAVHYRLTRQSIYRGSKQGWPVPRIIQFLGKACGVSLPQNVVRDLSEWETALERIVVRQQVVVLEARAPDVFDGPLIGERLASAVASRPDPRLVVFRPGVHADDVQQVLIEQGQLPSRTRHARFVARPCLSVDAAGVITFQQQVPSVYLYAYLAPFTSQGAHGQWQLTADSVRSAVERGWNAISILDALQAVHVGPLLFHLEAMVKTWAQHFGTARMQNLTLIQLDSQEILDELLQDPELAPFLVRFGSPDVRRALAAVNPEHASHVRGLLLARGMTIDDHL
jgi:hypothetical protein